MWSNIFTMPKFQKSFEDITFLEGLCVYTYYFINKINLAIMSKDVLCIISQTELINQQVQQINIFSSFFVN